MKNLSVSRRYAKALLLIGKEDNKAEDYKKELNEFVKLIEKEADLLQAINNPLYETASRKKILQIIIEKLQLSSVMKSFLILLFDKGRMKFVSVIDETYRKLCDELKGVAHATLFSASELSSETIEKIRAVLSKKTGKNIRLEVKQDQSLIGGIITKIGDFVLDGSIKTQLLNMKESLKGVRVYNGNKS
ncbi:MAG: ATP synthase F1 subunit delta [Deltaproteobacteria bacterium]|nr:ATP synthase F1 subunit delta [Deltaproteobacteria bacterium]